MALVLVQHVISDQIVEIEEIQLAHPWFGPLYKRVRVNEDGKPYVLNPTDAADLDEADNSELIDTEVEADFQAAAAREEIKKAGK